MRTKVANVGYTTTFAPKEGLRGQFEVWFAKHYDIHPESPKFKWSPIDECYHADTTQSEWIKYQEIVRQWQEMPIAITDNSGTFIMK